MNPHSKQRPLFFTPRSPWGGRLESQSFRRHMRASEDRKLDPASKNAQGLAGQMAPNLPGDSGGQSAQTGGSVWKVPHAEIQPYQQQPVPQPPATTVQQLSTQGPLASTQQQWRSSEPVTFGKDEPATHVEGTISAEANGRFQEGALEGEAGVSLPGTMNTQYDPLVRGNPPAKTKQSGAPLYQIDKRQRQYYKDPEKK